MGGGSVAMKVEPVNVYFTLPYAEGDKVGFSIRDAPTVEEAKSAFCDLKDVQKMLSLSEILLPAELDGSVRANFLNACTFVFQNPAAEDFVVSLATDDAIFEVVRRKEGFQDFVQSGKEYGEAVKGPEKTEGRENWLMRLLKWIKNCVSKFAGFVSQMASRLARSCCDLFVLASKEKVAVATLSAILTILVAVLKRF